MSPRIATLAPDEILKPEQVCEIRHMTLKALAQERVRGTGPKYIRDGRRIRYRASDLAAYFEAHTVTPEGA